MKKFLEELLSDPLTGILSVLTLSPIVGSVVLYYSLVSGSIWAAFTGTVLWVPGVVLGLGIYYHIKR